MRVISSDNRFPLCKGQIISDSKITLTLTLSRRTGRGDGNYTHPLPMVVANLDQRRTFCANKPCGRIIRTTMTASSTNTLASTPVRKNSKIDWA